MPGPLPALGQTSPCRTALQTPLLQLPHPAPAPAPAPVGSPEPSRTYLSTWLALAVQFSAVPPKGHGPCKAVREQCHLQALVTSPVLFSTSLADYDECERMEDDCVPGTSCRNTLGSFTCSCEGGAPDFHVEYSGRPCEGNCLSLFLEYRPLICSFRDAKEVLSK